MIHIIKSYTISLGTKKPDAHPGPQGRLRRANLTRNAATGSALILII